MASLVFRSSLVLSLAAVSIALSGCYGSDDSNDDYGYGAGAASGSGAGGSSATAGGSSAAGTSAGGSSSTGGSGGSSTYVPPSCDQECQDYLVSRALYDTVWFIWNQNLVGVPVGVQDFTADCPLGGSAHVTGMNDVTTNGDNTVDMLYDLTNCENLDDVYSLTFSGEITVDGSWNSNTDFAAVSYAATGMLASGSLDYYDQPAIDDTCDMDFVHEGGGDTWKMVGRRCDRAFNSETALELGSGGSTSGSGGSSSGGSSSGGTSGNACACYCPDGSDCTNATDPNPCGVDSNGIPEACGCPVGCR